MPPETMTLAGHAAPDAAHRVCQPVQPCANPTAAPMLVQRPLSPSSASSSSSSLWSGGTTLSAAAQVQLSAEAAAPKVLVHEYVPHCRQFFSWDCGLACVQMVLISFGYPHCDYALLRQLCPTTSVWTVDLAHLLVRFRLAVSFYTVTLGPNPAYDSLSFYMEHKEDDEVRVSRLFREAAHAGIGLEQRSVGSEELKSWLLSGDCLVILLVDKRRMDPWLMAADMCLPALCGMELGYLGHYVLLVGFDGGTQEYVLRDPAALVPELRVSAAALDAARRAFGTDEDILVVRAGGAAPLRHVRRGGGEAGAAGPGPEAEAGQGAGQGAV